MTRILLVIFHVEGVACAFARMHTHMLIHLHTHTYARMRIHRKREVRKSKCNAVLVECLRIGLMGSTKEMDSLRVAGRECG